MLNANVRFTLLYALLLSIASSLTFDNVFAQLIKMLRNDNTSVGIASGVKGTTQLLLALPAGWIADRIGRQAVLRAASAFALLSVGYTAIVLTMRHRFSDDALYALLLGGTALWGVFMGLHSAPLAALFGDSVASGRRSKLYVWRASLRVLGSSIGPAVSASFFFATGDSWQVHQLVWVLYIGLAASLLPVLVLWTFRDSAALGAASEGLHVMSAAADAPGGSIQRADAACEADNPADDDAAVAAAAAAAALLPPARRRWLSPELIAPTIALADLTSMLGSGMTIRFFSLFFWNDEHMQPGQVNLVYVAAPLGISLCGLLAQRLSLRIGRIQTSILCRVVGISLLVALSFLRRPALVVALYLLRTWLMNCTQGLSKSVLNDYVPKRHRAKWNALESVNAFGWSGSAMLGGWLTDRLGYRHTFLITASLQSFSVLLYVPLALLVASETTPRRDATRAATAPGADDDEGAAHPGQPAPPHGEAIVGADHAAATQQTPALKAPLLASA